MKCNTSFLSLFFVGIFVFVCICWLGCCCCCCCCSLVHDVTARTQDLSTAPKRVLFSILCCPVRGFRDGGGVGVSDGFRGGGGVFLLEVQYSILKSLISTCVLSYVGSREDWLLDRICES